MLRALILSAPALLAAAPAWADTTPPPPLPEPGIAGLVAAGVVGAIALARLRR